MSNDTYRIRVSLGQYCGIIKWLEGVRDTHSPEYGSLADKMTAALQTKNTSFVDMTGAEADRFLEQLEWQVYDAQNYNYDGGCPEYVRSARRQYRAAVKSAETAGYRGRRSRYL